MPIELRVHAAAKAAPYIHRQLKSVEQTGQDGGRSAGWIPIAIPVTGVTWAIGAIQDGPDGADRLYGEFFSSSP